MYSYYKLNTINPAYIAKLGFILRSTNILTQNIDSSILDTYGMAIIGFEI